ncbi:MAG TPA: DUF669 domain-containing protein [Gemmatimonadaceae bacterium]|jgi:hypothetical protein
MASDLSFDASKVAPSTGKPDPVPNGEYTLAITESDVTPTKAGTGKILNLTISVLAPESFKGRKIFTNLNISNPSAEAQRIAQAELSAICHATGVMQLKNSSQLHSVPFKGRVAVKQDAEYGPKNVITKYMAMDGSTAAAPLPAAAAASTSAAPAANAPAWAQKKTA